jgi:hypothetical protein
VAYQAGHLDIDLTKKYGNVGVVCVFYTFWVVMEPEYLILSVPIQPEESPVRTPPFEGNDF